MLQGAKPTAECQTTDASLLVEVQSKKQAAKSLGAFSFMQSILDFANYPAAPIPALVGILTNAATLFVGFRGE